MSEFGSPDLIKLVTGVAFVFSITNFSLNFFLIFAIFVQKKVQKRADFTLIYCRFAVDMLYSLDNTVYLTYMLVKLKNPNFAIKNLPFYVAWPNFNLGTMRCWLVFLIGFDRVLAVYTPIFYYNNRSKVPLSGIFLFIGCYALFEQYILFVLCDFVVDVPLDCSTFRCAIEMCYHDYWKWYQQIMYSTIGFLSVVLFFRLFVWNNCKKNNSKAIERATRISLLDSFIIFAFDFFPVFLTAHWPQYNTKTVGPVGSLCKSLGFVIESSIICNVLLGNRIKTVRISQSQTSPSNYPVVY